MPKKRGRGVRLINTLSDKYACLKCDYIVGSERMMKLHIKYTHGERLIGETQFLCTICKKSFMKDEHLMDHIKRNHKRPR